LCILGVLLLATALAPTAGAAVPEWLRSAADVSLPTYPEETKAVVLLDEQVVTVRENGEITILSRKAYKILRPEGRGYGKQEFAFDSETRILRLQGWCLPAQGKEYEVKEKDAVETGWPNGGDLYTDTRKKILTIPAAEPGNVIGYEVERRQRPYILQDSFYIDEQLPQRLVRVVLQLPASWEYKATWINHAPVGPQSAGANQWVWQFENLPALEHEPHMPPFLAVAGRLGLSYLPRSGSPGRGAFDSWQKVGAWYSQLTAGRRDPTPEMQQKVGELTAGATTTLAKMRALADFMQQKIRYVSIQIGIGGYQPHPARDVFSRRYGDCKDKATLLSAMLAEIGVKSYYVVVHNRRGMAAPSFPTPINFNHVVLAIRLPEDVPTQGLNAVYKSPQYGTLLIFDPTNEMAPLGDLPDYLQGNYALLVGDDGGELVHLPLLSPATSRLDRIARMTLNSDGSLSGEVEERSTGWVAADLRQILMAVPANERGRLVENYLAHFVNGARLEKAAVANVENYDRDLVLRYGFAATHYAKTAGNLLLVRPRVLEEKSRRTLEQDNKPRKFPVEFDGPSLQTDVFEITLPPGYKVDELPLPVDVDTGAVRYRSKVEVKGNVLHYESEFQVKDVLVPLERMPELKKLFRQQAADERSAAVFKRSF